MCDSFEWYFCTRLHFLPSKNRPQDFSDSTYQSLLPPHARSTATQVCMYPVCYGVMGEHSNVLLVTVDIAMDTLHVPQLYASAYRLCVLGA